MSSQPFVHAILVTDGFTPYCGRTIEQLNSQSHAPDLVTVVDVAEKTNSSTLSRLCVENKWQYLANPQAHNLGAAVQYALSVTKDAENGDKNLTDNQWLWLLHDDSAPETDCLEKLVSRLATVRTVGVIGTKQRSWDHPEQLLELGIAATRSGRRYDHLRGELDQGQYDHTEDVLAVSTAGMLVMQSLWESLGGTDPSLVKFGEGLEFGRRAHLAGWRVIVEPQAITYHAEATYRGLRKDHETENISRSFGSRKAAQIYNWMLAAPLWQLPILMLLLPFLQVGRALVRVISRSPALAWEELKALLKAIALTGKIMAARNRTRSVTNVPASSLRRLEVSPHTMFKYRWIDRRVQRANLPTEVLEPVAAQGLKVRRERSLFGLLIVLLAAFVAAFIFWGPRLVGLTGSAFLTLPPDLSTLWSYAWTAWVPQGLGAEAPTDPLLAVFAVLLSPFAVFGIELPAALRVLLFISPVLAALGAWLAAGTFTRALPLRIWAALTWISLPAYWISVAQGRVSVIMFSIAAPYVIWGFMRGGLLHKSEIVTGAAGGVVVRSISQRTRHLTIAALALWVAVAAQPALIVAAWALSIFGLITFRSRRFSALLLPLPASIQIAPFLSYAYRNDAWQALFGSIDKPVVTPVANSLQLAAGWPTAPSALSLIGPWWMWSLPLAFAALAALLVTLRPGRRGWLVRGLWILALAVAGATVISRNLAVSATDQIVNAWPGIGLLMVAGVLIVIVAAGYDRAWVLRPRKAIWATPAVVAAAVMTLATATVMVAPSAAAYVSRQLPSATVAGTHYAIPASAEQASQSERRGRVLVLTASENGAMQARIWRHAGATYVEHNAILDVQDAHTRTRGETAPATDSFSIAMGQLRSGQHGENLPLLLANNAVEQVVLTEWDTRAGKRVKSQLEATEGLEAIGATEAGLTWRVASPDTSSDAGAIALRAYVENNQGRILVPSGPLNIKTSLPAGTSGILHLAENYSSGWKATVNGQPLEPVPGDMQSFKMPNGGQLAVTWTRDWLRWWQAACALSYLLMASGVIFSYRRRQA
ncbi:glycosyltransferase [Boudabousia marimammalium]|uniref:Glycosyltransferase 2-like domain-containing protein n=1 Tax=Boudabousia marimammalium TaxID=156892 RepID=A0A1Q5PRQ1_9ACTO|nr:glycosyltransferase [Boudabousia marimammalium]OKL50213.1 hypothetical protein BM477_02130 [Boudabousia marimammalium]